MWPRPRRASASARRMTRRLLAERRTPRRAAQVGHQPSAGCCAAAVPHQQLVPPPRRPAAPRWLRERATSGVDWGWGGVGASLHPALAGRLIETDERVERRARFRFLVSGGKKGQPELSLSEIAISLNCEQNSARKFQTGVSNSGAQIPKHARQNSEGGRFPVSHYKTRSRGHRFL